MKLQGTPTQGPHSNWTDLLQEAGKRANGPAVMCRLASHPQRDSTDSNDVRRTLRALRRGRTQEHSTGQGHSRQGSHSMSAPTVERRSKRKTHAPLQAASGERKLSSDAQYQKGLKTIVHILPVPYQPAIKCFSQDTYPSV